MYKYIVFDVGCLECGEGSHLLGKYKTKEEAQAFIDDYIDDTTSWGRPEWHGQHDVGIYEIKTGELVL